MTVDARGGIIIPANLNGDTITKHMMIVGVGTVSINPNSASAGASVNTDVAITGVKVGDLVCMLPPDSLESDLVFQGAAVVSPGTVRVVLRNVDETNAINGAALDWGYLLISKTEP